MRHDDSADRRDATPQPDDLDAPLRYSTDTYVAPRRSLDTEPVYVDVLEALALLPRERDDARRGRP